MSARVKLALAVAVVATLLAPDMVFYAVLAAFGLGMLWWALLLSDPHKAFAAAAKARPSGDLLSDQDRDLDDWPPAPGTAEQALHNAGADAARERLAGMGDPGDYEWTRRQPDGLYRVHGTVEYVPLDPPPDGLADRCIAAIERDHAVREATDMRTSGEFS